MRRCFGLHAFEILHHLPALAISSGMLAAKLCYNVPFTYMHIFLPLYIASAFNVYFHFIVFAREAQETRQVKTALSSSLFNIFRVALFIAFEVMLYRKIDGDFEHRQVATQNSWRTVFLPLWVLLICFGFQGCRAL
uniref:TLC domain-containing protein n=1 Tax=Panagrellus redivivus TaxID=6233 RepID=A0A7E4V419_PANRE